MIEKGTRGGICNSIHQYTKANNKYIKNYDKNKQSSYVNYSDVNDIVMSQKLPTFNFKQVEHTSQFKEDFIKNFNEKSEEGYFLQVDVQYPISKKKYMNLIVIYHFYLKERILEKSKSLLVIYIIQMNLLFT